MAEDKLQKIINLLLLRLKRLQDRQAEVDKIKDPKKRDKAQKELDKEKEELNKAFKDVEQKSKSFSFKLPKLDLMWKPLKFQFGWG